MLRGRVASLLEVGTGFHPELTGRENIFLNGAILGMRRPRSTEVRRDRRVLADVERFIDTPVKRYSSGMYVRLAFAVAAHLEPEILLVDEVLAVGDAEFQKKCLGKMQDVSEHGRTVVFVSHNLGGTAALPALLEGNGGCRRADGGGAAARVGSEEGARGSVPTRTALGPAPSACSPPRSSTTRGSPLGDRRALWRAHAFWGSRRSDAVVELGISGADGTRLVTAHTIDRDGTPFVLDPGNYEIQAWLGIALLPGELQISVALHRLAGLTLDLVEGVLSFSVINTTLDESFHYPWNVVRGSVRPESTWSISAGSPVASSSSVLS